MREGRRQKAASRIRRLSARQMGCLLPTAFCVLASLGCPATQAAELKIGYVNPAAILDNYQRTKDAEQALQQKSKQKQAELEGRVDELKKLRQGAELLNDQAREAKTREIEEKSDAFKRLKVQAERELLRERNEMLKTIVEEINQAVSEYAKGNHFSLVVDERFLLYGESGLEITDAVVKLLNERHAAKKGKQP